MSVSTFLPTRVELAAQASQPSVATSLQRPRDSSALLRVRGLCVEVTATGSQSVRILNNIAFEVEAGETIGILGESGCGKTTLARALLGVLPRGLGITGGTIHLDERDLVESDEVVLRTIRGNRISLVHQEAEGALHPLIRVRDQIAEIFRAHRSWNYRRCREESQNVLEEVFATDADRMGNSYPHELSGGQRQRILIAQAIACRPALVIADEPTASLDLTTRSQIVSLLSDLKRRHGMALILITHNPVILRQLADRVIVMYAGRIIEQGSSESIFDRPLHPYTRALLNLERRSDFGRADVKRKLLAIPGSAPDVANLPSGCTYEPRCEFRMPSCRESEPALIPTSPEQEVRCVLYEH